MSPAEINQKRLVKAPIWGRRSCNNRLFSPRVDAAWLSLHELITDLVLLQPDGVGLQPINMMYSVAADCPWYWFDTEGLCHRLPNGTECDYFRGIHGCCRDGKCEIARRRRLLDDDDTCGEHICFLD